MSTDTEKGGDRMEKIDVRVPSGLLQQIEEKYEERGYSSRSEAVRDALRDWVNPPAQLSEETLEALATSREQAEDDETASAGEARERLGLDD